MEEMLLKWVLQARKETFFTKKSNFLSDKRIDRLLSKIIYFKSITQLSF